jgi:hypothetical protein
MNGVRGRSDEGIGYSRMEGNGMKGQNWALMPVTAEDWMNKSVSVVYSTACAVYKRNVLNEEIKSGSKKKYSI